MRSSSWCRVPINSWRPRSLHCASRVYSALSIRSTAGRFEYLAVDELKHSYLLLRRVENLLQATDDKQTQTLPNNPLDWARLPCARYGQRGRFTYPYSKRQRAKIHRHFKATVGGEEGEERPSIGQRSCGMCKILMMPSRIGRTANRR